MTSMIFKEFPEAAVTTQLLRLLRVDSESLKKFMPLFDATPETLCAWTSEEFSAELDHVARSPLTLCYWARVEIPLPQLPFHATLLARVFWRVIMFHHVSLCFIMFHHVSSEVCRSAVANGQTERSASQRKRWAHLFGISNRLELLSAQLVQKRQDCARLTDKKSSVWLYDQITYWRCCNRF